MNAPRNLAKTVRSVKMKLDFMSVFVRMDIPQITVKLKSTNVTRCLVRMVVFVQTKLINLLASVLRGILEHFATMNSTNVNLALA